MDRPLSEERLRSQKRRKWLLPVVVVLGLAAGFSLLRSQLEARVKQSEVILSTVEKGSIEATLTASGTIVPEYEQALTLQADREQLEQVLTNAIKNARESIGTGGQIVLYAEPDNGRWGVADNGPGIPQDKANLLFKPFYSSKKDGQGVGLTLSREVLTQHGFPFRLATDPDGITRFEVKSIPSKS